MHSSYGLREIGCDFGVGVLYQDSGIVKETSENQDLWEIIFKQTIFNDISCMRMGGMHLRRVAHNGRTIGLGGKLELSGESGP